MRSIRNSLLLFAAGVLLGAVATWAVMRFERHAPQAELVEPAVCYSCFWQGYDAKLHKDLVEYYRQYKNPDPLVLADTSYILWRATSIPNCNIRNEYRRIAKSDGDAQRRYVAFSVLAFGAGHAPGFRGSDAARVGHSRLRA